MNLEDFKRCVDFLYENALDYGEPFKEVVVTTYDKSIVARGCSVVNNIYMGMDTETGQIRIQTADKLVKQGNNYTDEMDIVQRKIMGVKQMIYACPRCDDKGNKSDKFCRHCVQKIKNYISMKCDFQMVIKEEKRGNK